MPKKMLTKNTNLDQTALRITRREFLGAAGGLVLGFVLPSLQGVNDVRASGTATAVNSWLQIGTDDSISLTIGASEMGQGSFSGLAQILSEDLMVTMRDRHRAGRADTGNPAPIGTANQHCRQRVTRNNYWRMRDAGAIAREMLVQAAMNRNGDPTRGNYA
jgi:isoquinoline 1-oxidoreductase beta subunit